jgi:hypothetical protein
VTDLPTPKVCDLVKETPGGCTCPAGLPVPHGTVLTRRTLRSVAFLVLLALAVTGVNLLYTAHAVNSDNQQRCASVLADATIPLPHPIAGNPSREWEAAFEANARHRARQLGCES